MTLDPVDLVIRAIDNTGPQLDAIFRRIAELERLTAGLNQTTVAAGQAQAETTGVQVAGLGRLTQGVTGLAFSYNQITGAIASLVAVAKPAYDLLIGQNIALESQLLGTQSTLAATNKVIQNGLELADPTKAIQALEGPVNEAVDRIRKGSLELVGVTSAELIPLLQIVAGQSSQIGATLNESADLTLSFAAALGTLGIPLDQARQEMTSILTGTIDVNSVLAKSLNLTSAQVNLWQSQGTLVEKLTERLEAFRAGNQLGAQTIGGITSNMVELLEVATQVAGKPLLEPIVEGLNSVYEFLASNEAQIQGFFGSVTGFILEFGEEVVGIAKTLQPAIATLAEALLQILSTAVGESGKNVLIFADILGLLAQAIAPLLQIVASLTKVIADLLSSDIGELIVQAGLLTAAFIALSPAAIAVGAAIALLPAILAGVSFSFAGLSTAIAALKVAALAAYPGIATLLLLLAPYVAAASVIAITLAFKNAEDLKFVNNEIAIFREQNDAIGNQSIKVATNLKTLNDIKLVDGKLTAEQTKQLEGYKIGAVGLIEQLKGQNKSMRELHPANEAQKNDIKTQIELNEILIKTLDKQSGGLELKARELEKLGNQFEQLDVKASSALRIINEGGGGDPVRFAAATKELVSLTEQQVELGQISREEGVLRLEAIRDDARVEVEIQQSAQKQITAIRTAETENQVKAIDQRVASTNTAVASERLGEAAGAAEVTRLKGEQLKIQLAQVTKAIAEEESLRQTQLQSQLAALRVRSEAADQALSAATAKNDAAAIAAAKIEKDLVAKEITGVEAAIALSSQSLTDLKAKATGINSQITQNTAEGVKQRRSEEIKDYDERQSLLQADFDKRLISEADFNQRSLQISSEKIAEQLRQLEEQRKSLPKTDTEGLEAITVKEAALRAQLITKETEFQDKQSEIRVASFDNQLSQLDSLHSRQLVSQSDYNNRSLKLNEAKIAEQLKQLQVERDRTPDDDIANLERLAAEEAALLAKRSSLLEQYRVQQYELRVSVFDSELTELNALYAQKLITEAEYNERSLEMTRAKGKEELAEIERLRARTPPNDIAALEKLEADEAVIRQRIFETEERIAHERYQARLAHYDAEQKILEGALAAGEVTEQEYNNRSLRLTQDKLAAELDEIARQRSQLLANDKVALEKLAAQEADVRIRQLEALEQYQQRQIDIIERAQDKANDIIRLSEIERNTQIDQLENANLISKAEAGERRAQIARNSANQELAIERDKLAKLIALPAFSDPVKEENRQSQIRSSRIATAQLTQKLAREEFEEQQAAYQKIVEAIDQRSKAVQNAVAAENLAYQEQERILAGLSKSLELQGQLLAARKSVSDSLTNYYVGELTVLDKLNAGCKDRIQYEEAIAAVKLDSLTNQQQLERDILELNLKQKEAALELEKIRNRSAASQNRADIAQARADIAKTRARIDLTPQDRALQENADRLNLLAKFEKGFGISQEAVFLDKQGELNSRFGQIERDNLYRKQQVDYDNARFDFEAKRGPEGKAEAQALYDEILARILPGLPKNESKILNAALENYSDTVAAQNFRDRFGNQVNQIETPTVGGGITFDTSAPEFAELANALPPELQAAQLKFIQEQVNIAKASTEGLIQLTGDLKMENNISVTLNSPKDKQLGVDIEQTILNSLESTFTLVKDKLK